MSLRDKGTWRQPFQPSKQPDSLASLQGHFAATLSRQEDVGKDYRPGRSNFRRAGRQRTAPTRLAGVHCCARDGRTPSSSGCGSVRNVQAEWQDTCRYAKHILAPAGTGVRPCESCNRHTGESRRVEFIATIEPIRTVLELCLRLNQASANYIGHASIRPISPGLFRCRACDIKLRLKPR